MPRRQLRSLSPASLDLLDILAPQRRREILEEAVGSYARAVIAQLVNHSLDEMVAALVADTHWRSMRELPLAAVLVPTPADLPSTTVIDATPANEAHQSVAFDDGAASVAVSPVGAAVTTHLSLSDFIRSMPAEMRPMDVVAQGAVHGLKISISLVSKTRARDVERAARTRSSGVGAPTPRPRELETAHPRNSVAPAAQPISPAAVEGHVENAAEISAAQPILTPVGNPATVDAGVAASLAGGDSKAVANALAEALGETNEQALKELQEVVDAYGLELVRAAFAKTLEVEAAGGMVREGRRKTPGGVFFYFVKARAGREILGPQFAQVKRVPKPAAAPPPIAVESAPRPAVAVSAPPRPAMPRAAFPNRPIPRPMPTSRPARSAPAAPRKPDVTDAMVHFIGLNPGLREDEIRLRLGGDRDLIRATLNALRIQKRVLTTGSGASRRYSAPA